jgi:hypothetical protein
MPVRTGCCLRWLLICPVVALIPAACASGGQPEYMIAREGDIEVLINAVDERGRPVPHMEVWRLHDPVKGPLAYEKQRIPRQALDRWIARYKSSPELIREDQTYAFPFDVYGHTVQVAALADASGHTRDVVKLSGARPRDVPVKLAYAALATGFEPQVRDVEVGLANGRVVVHLEMRAAPSRIDAKAMQEANRIRYAYYNVGGQGLVTMDEFKANEAQRSNLKRQLINLGEALVVSDPQSAAAVLALAAQLRGMVFTDEQSGSLRVSGYSREESASGGNIALLERGRALQPADPYIRMRLLLLVPPVDPAARVEQRAAVLALGSDAVYPRFLHEQENDLYLLGRTEEAKAVFDRLLAFEPDYVHNVGDMRDRRAVRYVSLEEFRRWIAQRPKEARSWQYSPFRLAIFAGREDLARWLVESDQVTVVPLNILGEASIHPRKEVFSFLLSQPSSITGIDRNQINRVLEASVARLDSETIALLREARDRFK